jgi:hypothetical protein
LRLDLKKAPNVNTLKTRTERKLIIVV